MPEYWKKGIDGDRSEQLPLYKCSKMLRAAKITGITYASTGGAVQADLLMILELEGDLPPVCVSLIEYGATHQPVVGGYYLQTDGQESYSPAAAFEAWCTPVEI
jgi:hypothetical protein